MCTGNRIWHPYLGPRRGCPYVPILHGSVFARLDEPNRPAEFDEVLRLAHRPSPSADGTLLIDARPEPSYQAGHIPTSLLLDFPSSLLEDPDKFTYLREPEALKKHVAEKLGQNRLEEILTQKVTVVNSEFGRLSQEEDHFVEYGKLTMLRIACGGGLSAAINWLSLKSLGVDSRLYDEVSSLYPKTRPSRNVD